MVLEHLRQLVTPIDDRASSFGPIRRYNVVVFLRLAGETSSMNDMAELTQSLDINTLHNIYVVQELLQLSVGLYVEIIANYILQDRRSYVELFS